jgi:hypothetical protein
MFTQVGLADKKENTFSVGKTFDGHYLNAYLLLLKMRDGNQHYKLNTNLRNISSSENICY